MIPYIILLTVPILAAPFLKKYKINRFKLSEIPLLFFFVFLTVLVMLRHPSVGNDTPGYIFFFKNTIGVPWDQMRWGDLESGFQAFMKLISLFSEDPQVFLAVSGITVSILIYPTYRRVCVDSSLTIVIFCVLSTFVMLFSGIRQMLAVGIGFIAYEFTRRRKLILFVLAVLLAMLFHSSSFMLIFMYPVYHMRITKKSLLVVVPTLIAIFIFNGPIFSVIGTFIGQYTRFEINSSSTGAYTIIVLFSLFTLFAFLVPDNDLVDDETVGLRNFLLLSLIIQFFSPLNFLAMRLNYYFIIFIPLLLPKIILYRSKKWEQVAILGRYVMIIFFYVYFFINAYTSLTNLHVFPYHFFWENVV